MAPYRFPYDGPFPWCEDPAVGAGCTGMPRPPPHHKKRVQPIRPAVIVDSVICRLLAISRHPAPSGSWSAFCSEADTGEPSFGTAAFYVC